MKQIYIETQAKDQVHQNCRNANSEVHCSIIRILPNSDFLNIFLIQNKGKGPPGNILHPDHPPDSTAGPPDINPVRFRKPYWIETSGEQTLKNPSIGRSLSVRLSSHRSLSEGRSLSLSKGNFNTKVQTNNTNQNSNFLQTLNFTNMKKQILFLAFFVLAVFAGMNKSYGQLNTDADALTVVPTFCTPAIALACGSIDALHPAPGVSYPYTISTSSAGSTVHFFVTDDTDIITTQGAIAAAIEAKDGTGNYILTADAAYNAPTNTSPTVNITWKSFDGAVNTVILVVYNIDAAGCTNNIQAWRIEPEYAFTLDVAGIADDGATGGAAVTECVVPIQSASYDGANLTVDYGTNWVFFTVRAANWQTSWETNLSATLAAAGSTLGAPEWQYPAQANVGGAWNASGTPVLASQYTSGADGWIDNVGECIIVRVPVVHTAFENLANETVNLVVNGEMINAQSGTYDGTYPDLDETAANSACKSDLTTDNVNYVITPRPTVTDTTPNPFETKTF